MSTYTRFLYIHLNSAYMYIMYTACMSLLQYALHTLIYCIYPHSMCTPDPTSLASSSPSKVCSTHIFTNHFLHHQRTTSAGYRIILYDDRLLASYGLTRSVSEGLGSLGQERSEVVAEDEVLLAQIESFIDEYRLYSNNNHTNATPPTSTTTTTSSPVTPTPTPKHMPLKHIYYTESDQIIHYDSIHTLHALTAATNQSTFFVPRRREKDPLTGSPPQGQCSNIVI